MKQVAGTLKLDLAQFRDLAAFAQFGSDLDRATKAKIDRGLRQQEIMKQKQYAPMSVEHQIMIIYAASKGYLDQVPVEKVAEWESQFHRYMDANSPELVRASTTRQSPTRRNCLRRSSPSSTRRSTSIRRWRRASATLPFIGEEQSMASTREIRRRIQSVKNVAQITRAVQMVASSKMRRAQERVLAARPYSEQLIRLLSRLSAQAEGQEDLPLDAGRATVRKSAPSWW